MNEQTVFSVVIPAYNEGKNLPGCIESIRSQKGGFTIEIIVVDNNSTDNTGQIARDLGATVVLEGKQGVGAARRAGVAVASGQYVVNLDADTHLPEDYFQNVLVRFQKNSKLVCLGGQFYFYDGKRWQNSLRPLFFWLFLNFARLVTWGRMGPTGNNMTFKKLFYDKTNGFDQALCYGEDSDLAKKLSYFGQVKLDTSLKCYTSARRFKLDHKLWEYIKNYFRICLVGKPLNNYLPPHD